MYCLHSQREMRADRADGTQVEKSLRNPCCIVGNWDDQRKVVMRYPVQPDGTLGRVKVFFDTTSAEGEDEIAGIKVDTQGNLYVSGPGGLWILSPSGWHLGTLRSGRHPDNMAWGDADGKTLYLAAQSGLYRVRLQVFGASRDFGTK